MIDNITIQRVKDAASIVDVISDFYELKRSGVEYECRCPFHQDRHLGSFKITPRKNYAKCFSCGWQGGPVDFLMQHEKISFLDAIRWLGKKYGIEVEGMEKFDARPSTPRQQLPDLPMLVIPHWMVTRCENLDNDILVRWIRSIPWDASQRNRIDKSLKAYHIGHSIQGFTMFWQIDENSVVRTGKMMLYKSDGHRNRDARYNFDWVHSALYREPRLPFSPDKTDVKPCLFGLHLLDAYPQATVCIVESEKTALVMSIAYGNNPLQVWMACGGLENLNRDKLRPIIDRKRNIMLYPDRDAVDKWKAKARQLDYERMNIDIQPVTEWWKPCDGQKADIADVVVRMTVENPTVNTVGDVIETIPIVKELKERLGLERV
jgi:hypothetical protein